MSKVWQLQEAKNKFSEVVEEAMKHGPQVVTKRGIETVIIIAYEEYQKLLLNQQKLSEFFQTSPLTDVVDELDLTRDPRRARDNLEL
ncbi:MAG: type II toxin-antitoxin system Phd/YefM family antitoxin [Chloroflexia bacterium]|nr:type II toxin-antitoxin system Phd/YefM family antitoxin [Chloroflexia bacterium]